MSSIKLAGKEYEVDKVLYFYPGKDNAEFWQLLDTLRNKGKSVESEWQGDFYVTEYYLEGVKYIYEEDMEYGIPYKISTIKEDK